MPKIVIASDSFKGSLSSAEVAKAVESGILRAVADAETISFQVGDGGEGTSSILARHLGAKTIHTIVSDPIGRPVEASWYIHEDTAIMEMAAASGLTLLKSRELNPMRTSTYGTGELIKAATAKGCREFIIGIGGSATNDGGTGMLEALGCRFLDINGEEIRHLCGGRLGDIYHIDPSGILKTVKDSEFIIACDVDAPFIGPDGATRVFSTQKGATQETMKTLEEGMTSLCKVINDEYGIDLSATPGSGAAGGLGGAFLTFLNSKLVKGIDLTLEISGFDKALEDADLVITGEGRIDSQSSKGKAISGVLAKASEKGVPVIAIAGSVLMSKEEIRLSGFIAVLPIGPTPQNESDLEYAMRPEVASKRISDTVSKALVSLFPSWCHESL